MPKIRVTSKHLGFMVALQTKFGIRYGRIFPHRWWWFRNRYEILIPIDERDSYKDYRTRSEILTVGSKCGCYQFDMEVINEEHEQHEWSSR